MFNLVAKLLFLNVVNANSDLDGDMLIAEITDGQREILAVMDEYYYTATGHSFWNSSSGFLTIGAMMMVMGMSIGISLICAWLRYHWSDIMSTVNNRAPLIPSTLGNNRQAHVVTRVHDTAITISDAPPNYDDLFQVRPCTTV